MQCRRSLIVCIAVALLIWTAGLQPRVAAQAPAAPQGETGAKPASEAKPQTAAQAQATPEQQDLATLSQLVDAVSAGTQQPPSAIPVSWLDQHFIKSQGDSIYIPFTISIDRSQLPSASTALYLRVVSRSAPAAPAEPGSRPTYAWDTINFVTVPADGRLSRAIALPPGTYDAFIAVKEKSTTAPAAGAAAAPPTLGLLRHELTVPSLTGTELAASSIILARNVEQLQAPPPADQQQENPYTFGTLKITPSLDGMFTKDGQLDILFWIYNASQTGGKPDVVVDYQFHHRQPGGELKYFNKTAPQPLNAETLPPEFNLTAGHQLLSSLAIPLASFPEGDYRLEITITDKPSGQTLTRNVDFSVSA